jgi:hypothetical protein
VAGSIERIVDTNCPFRPRLRTFENQSISAAGPAGNQGVRPARGPHPVHEPAG